MIEGTGKISANMHVFSCAGRAQPWIDTEKIGRSLLVITVDYLGLMP
jgi:hypothetical protein